MRRVEQAWHLRCLAPTLTGPLRAARNGRGQARHGARHHIRGTVKVQADSRGAILTRPLPYSIAQHNTPQYSTTQKSTDQHNTVPYNAEEVLRLAKLRANDAELDTEEQ